MSAGGLYSCYDERFPPELSNALSEHDFQRTILKINDDLANNSPCFTCNVSHRTSTSLHLHLFERSPALTEHPQLIFSVSFRLASSQALQYLCCPCTLGGSILCVRCMCQSVAMTGLKQDLLWANAPSEQGGRQTVEWRLGESFWDTWIEIEVLQQQQQPPRS
jgi:hypothetical protein